MHGTGKFAGMTGDGKYKVIGEIPPPGMTNMLGGCDRAVGTGNAPGIKQCFQVRTRKRHEQIQWYEGRSGSAECGSAAHRPYQAALTVSVFVAIAAISVRAMYLAEPGNENLNAT